MHEFPTVHPTSPMTDAPLQGVGRAFAVLELLTEGPLSGTQLARRLDLKWATAHRTLTTLTQMGYVEHDSRGDYRLGLRTHALGSAYVVASKLHKVGRPYLHAASVSAGVVAQLAERGGHSSIVLSVHEPKLDHVPETSVGCNFPLHSGSKGLVLLAWSEPAFVDEYLARPLASLTRYTLTDPAAVRDELARVRAAGYARTSRDVREFSASVAAPVFGPQGQLLAALTLVTTPERIDNLAHRLVDLVQRTAHGLSKALKAQHATPTWQRPARMSLS